MAELKQLAAEIGIVNLRYARRNTSPSSVLRWNWRMHFQAKKEGEVVGLHLSSNLERETGLEPATLCLGSRCATIAPFPPDYAIIASRLLPVNRTPRR
jgi:hypothetical protein